MTAHTARSPQDAIQQGIQSTLVGIGANLLLVLIKGTAGVLGNSFALIADAVESGADIFTSLIVFLGLKMAGKPADVNHPYGHGKFEPLAASVVALMLLGAAILISIQSVREIITPHHAPEAFTLIVLALVVFSKETLFRKVLSVGDDIQSSIVRADAWHHRSDALTSAAAFVGISIALIGGPGYESADDFAALAASAVIATNALRLLRPAILELLDTAPSAELLEEIRRVAERVPGVLGTHKCHVRKLGFDHFVDLDVLCDPSASIREGHDIAHNVGEAIQREISIITKVLVHIEPVDDFGRRSREDG